MRDQNTKLLLFQDYTVETQKQRRSFDAVKAAMRSRGIKYSIPFPAKTEWSMARQSGSLSVPGRLPPGWKRYRN